MLGWQLAKPRPSRPSKPAPIIAIVAGSGTAITLMSSSDAPNESLVPAAENSSDIDIPVPVNVVVYGVQRLSEVVLVAGVKVIGPVPKSTVSWFELEGTTPPAKPGLYPVSAARPE